MKKLILLIVILALFSNIAIAEDNEVTMYYFYGASCHNCAQMQLALDEITPNYPNLNIIKKEIYNDQKNRELFQQFSKAYDREMEGVPTIFIDDKVFIGYSKSIVEDIEEEIQKCSTEECIDPVTKLDEEPTPLERLTIPAVISAAAVDAINPCAFAVLIILLTTILATKSRKQALLAGLAFSTSIYISYFLMGLGLFSAIQNSGLTHIFYIAVAILAILVGLFNLKDYLWYGKWFIMEVPLSWRPRMKALLKGITSIPGAFLVGFVISLFLLPCTSGPYIVILGLLAKTATKNYATFLLLIYNFIFILPMLIITLAVYFGITTTEQAEHWRTKKLKTLHLIAGIIILILGIAMLSSVYFGWL